MGTSDDWDEEDLEADVAHLYYAISHDFSEPVRGIAGFARFLQRDCSSQLDQRGQRYLHSMLACVGRLEGLMRGVLAVSRAQRMEASRVEVAGRELVEEALAAMRSSGVAVPVEVEVEVRGELPVLRVNRRWAVEAVRQVLDNAVKFASEGRPPEVVVEGTWGPRGTGLVVRDRGEGVPVEHSERVLRLFQRLVPRRVPGVGAGLTVARTVARRHGGDLWLQDNPGGGLACFITFGDRP